MPKILILCTGNSCRSQMAEGFLRSFDNKMELFSAGTEPTGSVHPKAVQVMKEAGIDISNYQTKSVNLFTGKSFDYVITVCNGAEETCPVFTGRIENQIHIGFDDPAKATGTNSEIMAEFRQTRDEIREKFQQLYNSRIKN